MAAQVYTGTYESSNEYFYVRVTYSAARENGAWAAWVNKVELHMAKATGGFTVHLWGKFLINGTVSATVDGQAFTTGKQYATVWEGVGTKVPVTRSGKLLSFTLSFGKNSDYGTANSIYLYYDTTNQGRIENAGSACTFTVEVSPAVIRIDGQNAAATTYVGRKEATAYLGNNEL